MNLPKGFEAHLPLYRASGAPCGGATGKAAILRNITFSARQFTDVVRFELTDVAGIDPVSLTTLGHALAQGAAEILELDQREIRMVVDPVVTGRSVVRVFDAIGHDGGHMAELFRRGPEWLSAVRRTLYRSEAHDQKCRTACITCVLSSVSQEDASNGLLDRKAALAVLRGTGELCRSPLRSDAGPDPVSPGQLDMLAILRARKNAANANQRRRWPSHPSTSLLLPPRSARIWRLPPTGQALAEQIREVLGVNQRRSGTPPRIGLNSLIH
jgi:DEAD/DEAH box helicase domain-containing protein